MEHHKGLASIFGPKDIQEFGEHRRLLDEKLDEGHIIALDSQVLEDLIDQQIIAESPDEIRQEAARIILENVLGCEGLERSGLVVDDTGFVGPPQSVGQE